MIGLLSSIIYLAVVGLLSHIIGEAVPRSWFDPDCSWFSERSWEKNGAFYEKLNIRKWKDKLPDKSKFIKGMTPKRFVGETDSARVRLLISETCVSEFVHYSISVLSFGCVFLSGGFGFAVFLIFTLCNVPFAMVQRYNRPKLKKLYAVLLRKEQKKNCENASEKSVNKSCGDSEESRFAGVH